MRQNTKNLYNFDYESNVAIIKVYANFDSNRDGIIDISDEKIKALFDSKKNVLDKLENIYEKIGIDLVKKYTNIAFQPIKYDPLILETVKMADILAEERIYMIKRDIESDEKLLYLPEHEAIFEKAKVIANKILLHKETILNGGNLNIAFDKFIAELPNFEVSNMLAGVDFYNLDKNKDGIISADEALEKVSISGGLNKDENGNIVDTPVIDLIINSYRVYRGA